MEKTSLNQLYDIMYDHMDPTGCGLAAVIGKLSGQLF